MSEENVFADSLCSDSEIERDTIQNLDSGFIRKSENYHLSLPPIINKRVKALKKLLALQADVDAKFLAEMHVLECKYHKEYLPYYNKRSDIVQGNYEPTEEECDIPSDVEDDVKDLSTGMEGNIPLEESKVNNVVVDSTNEKFKGIPNFWLTILENCACLIGDRNIIHPHDEPILRHLTDVKVHLIEEPAGFALEFYFSPNEWFTNTVLTKEYEMKFVPNKSDPLHFKGSEIIKFKGCTIQWNEGKNVTVKVVEKKHKVKGAVRFVKKTVPSVSVFNFFSDPTNSETDEQKYEWFHTDFKIGHYIHKMILPRAVLYYTAEALLSATEFDEEE